MKHIIFTIIFIAFSTSALAETKVGEDQSPPKSAAGGCSFTRAAKKVDPSAPKTETKKGNQILDINGN